MFVTMRDCNGKHNINSNKVEWKKSKKNFINKETKFSILSCQKMHAFGTSGDGLSKIALIIDKIMANARNNALKK